MSPDTDKKEASADTPKSPKRPPNPHLAMMADAAGAEDYDAFAAEFSRTKNERYARDFAHTPYDTRILLIPQCLRSSTDCVAKEKGVFYECARCNACHIPEIIDAAESLGYLGVYILKGGRAVTRLIEEFQPEAIAGVACGYEGMIGIMECERNGIPVQFIPLSKDGCADTEVDIDSVRSLLAARED